MGSDSNNNDWFGPTSDIVNEVYPDVCVRNEGTIFLFTPISPRAKQWIFTNVQPDALWFGPALVVEHCYALGLAAGMRDAGLALSLTETPSLTHLSSRCLKSRPLRTGIVGLCSESPKNSALDSWLRNSESDFQARVRQQPGMSTDAKAHSLQTGAMSFIFYSAAWTECGCFIGCWHEHPTIEEGVGCINCADGYIVATENGVMRALTPVEEVEFQRAINAYRINRPVADAERTTREIKTTADSRYAVMIRVRIVDVWTWATWQVYDTYEQAAAYAREGNKVVRFRSLEWAALRQQTEDASPIVVNTRRTSLPLRSEGETFLGFVLRFLNACGFDQDGE